MDTMSLSDGATMSMTWMPMCGQSWLGAATSFLGMWTVMMTAMMLPSLATTLWRYRQAVVRAGNLPPALLMVFVACGYVLVWALLGAAVFPLGAATSAVAVRYPALARCVPIAGVLIVLIAGALQFTRWKAHHLACCREEYRDESLCGRSLQADASRAWRYGMRLGAHCSQCCAGLTAVLLVTGTMDWPAMLAVTAAINLERLAPVGGRMSRAIGLVVIAAGLVLAGRAVRFS